MPNAHAVLSPSAAPRWMTCPGSVALCAACPDSGSSFAAEGTAAHEVSSLLLEGKPVPSKTTDGYTVTDEMMDLVRDPVQWVLDYKARVGATILSEREIQIGLPAFGLDPHILWGTADVVGISKTELLIADFKFGYVEVEVEKNPQLLLYAIGMMYNLGWTPDQVRLAILQPRSAQPVKEVVYTAAEIADFEADFRPKVEQALAGGALVPSKACRWCKAAATCPALHNEQIALAQREFADPLTMPIEDIVKVLDKEEMILAFLKACRQHVTRLLELGQPVPGYKLVRGRKHRTWKDEGAAIEAFKKSRKVNIDQYAPRRLVTPAKAEKLLGKEFVAAYAHTPEGEKILVPESDPRPALGSDFGADDVKELTA